MTIAVMADGVVGRAIVRFFVESRPGEVCAVVVTDTGPVAEEISGICAAAGVATLRWRERAQLGLFLPEVLLLAWWPHILKGDDLKLAPIVLNTHPSLLPHCRGKDPNFWALAEGQPFGVTLHHVEATVDSGPIAFQTEIPYDWEATGASLYAASEKAMIALVAENSRAILTGKVPRIPQEAGQGSFHLRAELDPASQIDLDAPTTARQLLNLLRARTFPPHRACRFEDDGERYEVRVEIRRLPGESSE